METAESTRHTRLTGSTSAKIIVISRGRSRRNRGRIQNHLYMAECSFMKASSRAVNNIRLIQETVMNHYTRNPRFLQRKKAARQRTASFGMECQPLTPPWITPFSILSWKKGKAMMMGAMAAIITANWIRYRL